MAIVCETAGGSSCKQLTVVMTELKKVNRTLGQLKDQHIICKRQIKEVSRYQKADSLECANVVKIIVAKSFLIRCRCDNIRRQLDDCLEKIATIPCDEIKNSKIEEIHELEEELICFLQPLNNITIMIAEIETLLKLKEMKDKNILANLHEKRRKILQRRRAALAKRKKLLNAKIRSK